MRELQHRLEKTLREVAGDLRDAGLADQAAKMGELASQVPEPCVVAVVGRINAGKSRFINALLGDDLAKVGPTETTATINYFRYGKEDREYPVTCYWRDDRITYETRQFLDDLQNASIEALEKSSKIKRLEYCVQNEYLKEIVLVDTPGAGSVEAERQNRTEEFLNLFRQQNKALPAAEEARALELYSDLQEIHQKVTQCLDSQADAVIYLIGGLPTVSTQAFLDEFRNVTQGKSRSLNAIGIMAKIDLKEEIIDQREQFARDIGRQLRRELNTVIPVSAALQQALANKQANLRKIIQVTRPLHTSIITVLLSSPEAYCRLKNSPVSQEKWEQLRGEMDWTVFTLIVRLIRDHPDWDEGKVEEELKAVAGFGQVDKILNRHFLRRGSLLHCYRIVHEALKIREEVRTTQLVNVRKIDRENNAKRDRFIAFIKKRERDDPKTADELEQVCDERLKSREPLLQDIISKMERLNEINYELVNENEDFEALVRIEDFSELFSLEEREELERLLGLYGQENVDRLGPENMTPSYKEERQRYWIDRKERATVHKRIVETVADRAIFRYG